MPLRNHRSLQLKPGQVVYKCPKCCSIKPDQPTTAGTLCLHLGPARPAPASALHTPRRAPSPAGLLNAPCSRHAVTAAALPPASTGGRDGKGCWVWAQDTYHTSRLCHAGWRRAPPRPSPFSAPCPCLKLRISALPASQLYYCVKGALEAKL